jgi:transposase
MTKNLESSKEMEGLLSIDVSKKLLDARLAVGLADERALQVDNKYNGWRKLAKEAKAAGITKLYVCMEATGSLWKGVSEFFFNQNATVFVVNPARIKAQRKTEQKRSKTDKIDTGVILRFLRANLTQLKPWSPPSQAVSELQHLVRFREGRVAERARLQTLVKSKKLPASVMSQVGREREVLDGIIAELDHQIQELMETDPILRQQSRSADSVFAVGPTTSAVLISECRAFKEIQNPRQATAFAGLDVKEQSSGETRKPPRISREGSALLRKTFVCAAASAVKGQGVFRDFYLRLCSRGLKKKQALIAVARKLLEVTVAVVLAGAQFDPDRHRRKSAA